MDSGSLGAVAFYANARAASYSLTAHFESQETGEFAESTCLHLCGL